MLQSIITKHRVLEHEDESSYSGKTTTQRDEARVAETKRSLVRPFDQVAKSPVAHSSAVLMLALGIALGSPAAVTADLVGHWAMEPVPTPGLLKSDIPGTDGTLHNFPGDGSEWQPGVLGQALDFDGFDDYATHPFNLPLTVGTIGHWLLSDDSLNKIALYWSDYTKDAMTDYNGFGADGAALELHTGSLNDLAFGLYQDGSGKINQAGSGRWLTSGGPMGAWIHVAMTWDRSGDLVLYVNCVEVDRQLMSQGSFEDRSITERYFGRPSDASDPNRWWNGLIDEVRIYDTALTRQEIAAIFCRERRYERQLLSASVDGGVFFGESVALDGNTMITGFTRDSGGGTDSGAVEILERSTPSSDWTFTQHRVASGSVPFGFYGAAVDLSGDVAVVGAHGAKMAYILERDFGGIDNWGEAADRGPGKNDFGDYGIDVAVDEDIVAVMSNAGFVYLYSPDFSGAWALIHRIENSGIFFDAVALDGDTLAIGTTSGFQIHRRDQGGEGMWGLVREVPKPVDASFWAVEGGLDLNSGTLIVGSFGENDSIGAAYIFQRNSGGSDQWGLVQRLSAADGDRNDKFGYSVALASDKLALVGSRSEEGDHGVAYVFKRNNALWRQTLLLLGEDTDPREFGFGFSVAADGMNAVVGAPVQSSTEGRVYDFDIAIAIFADGFETGNTDQ